LWAGYLAQLRNILWVRVSFPMDNSHHSLRQIFHKIQLNLVLGQDSTHLPALSYNIIFSMFLGIILPCQRPYRTNHYSPYHHLSGFRAQEGCGNRGECPSDG
jgi:hypothetical protein